MLRVALTIPCLLFGIPSYAVDFDTEIIPLLTRAGCNAGACHGAAAGRGGFKLSLLGTDPAADYDAITRDFEGRRIHLVRPGESLVVLKPTAVLEHGGDQRFDRSSLEARTLEAWIREGARRGSRGALVSFEVEPRRALIEAPGGELRLCAFARYSDGSEEDVTARILLRSEDPELQVDSERPGVVRVGRKGRSILTARYLGAVRAVSVLVPVGERPVDVSGEPQQSYIDEHILAALASLRLLPGPPASDRAFARRLTLALTGRLPTPERVATYIADAHPAKRERFVDELLATDAFVRYWTYRLGELLHVRPVGGDERLPAVLLEWLRTQIAADTGLDRIVRALLLAEGDSHAEGPAGFYRLASGPRESAELVSEALLGVRLRCANCHDHPLDRWTQDDYHGLAAIFAGIERGRIVRVTGKGEVTNPRTGTPARARIPGERYVPGGRDPRTAFADWLVADDDRQFARAMVNRVWKELLGRGLVEPVDDLRETNPATHPALLDALAEDFVCSGFSLRHIVRRIATSETFARGSIAARSETVRRSWYTHATIRTLLPEVLADALSDVTDVPDRYGGAPVGRRAVDLANPLASSRSLDVLGRCVREASCTASAAGSGLERHLHLLNGPLLNARLGNPSGALARAVRSGREPLAILEEFFLRALARPPRADERTLLSAALSEAAEADALEETLEDVVWSLLVSREFSTNH